MRAVPGVIDEARLRTLVGGLLRRLHHSAALSVPPEDLQAALEETIRKARARGWLK
jgi:hypothetical protein